MPALLHESIASDYPFLNADNPPPSPSLADAVSFALQKYPGYKFLPSNYDSVDILEPNASPTTLQFSCDDFRMYEFKVRRCMRGRSHDWTECPYAHPGEKARRRDPRRIHYSGAPCPDFRKGSCRRGDSCEFAHGVFECWLHPARYRTQVCKDGKNCKRRVCFFAHSPEQLRILPASIASAAASMHTHTDTADGSPVGSPRGSLSQIKVSSEIPSSHVVFLSGSLGEAVSHMPPLSSSTATSSMPNSFIPHSTHQVSPISMHFDSLTGSPLRRAMARNFLACKGYGGGSFNLNVSPTEYSSVFDGYEGLAGVQLAHSSCASPQSRHIRSINSECSIELQEGGYPKHSLPLGPLDKSKYELASHSHGFVSPTSTLAGHIFSPPALSPPLSPLSSPNSRQIKGTVTNPLHSFYVDDTLTYRNLYESNHMYNADSMEDLAFSLQHLQIPEPFNHAGLSLQNAAHESRLAGMLEIAPLELSQSRPISLRHVSRGLSCTPKQSMWSPLSDFANSKDHGYGFLQGKDASANEMAAKIYGKIGEESNNMDNLMPDVGWVSELVK